MHVGALFLRITPSEEPLSNEASVATTKQHPMQAATTVGVNDERHSKAMERCAISRTGSAKAHFHQDQTRVHHEEREVHEKEAVQDLDPLPALPKEDSGSVRCRHLGEKAGPVKVGRKKDRDLPVASSRNALRMTGSLLPQKWTTSGALECVQMHHQRSRLPRHLISAHPHPQQQPRQHPQRPQLGQG